MYGIVNSNECPANSARIVDEEDCKRAAAAAGKAYAGSVRSDDYPKGCYYKATSDHVRFNKHLFGGVSSIRQLLCAAPASTTLKPPTPTPLVVIAKVATVLVDTSANTAASVSPDGSEIVVAGPALRFALLPPSCTHACAQILTSIES